MLWLFNYYNVHQDTSYIRDYNITFFDNTMTPYVITRKTSILVEDNIFKIITNDKNASDTDDSIEDEELKNAPPVNNWYNFFY